MTTIRSRTPSRNEDLFFWAAERERRRYRWQVRTLADRHRLSLRVAEIVADAAGIGSGR